MLHYFCLVSPFQIINSDLTAVLINIRASKWALCSSQLILAVCATALCGQILPSQTQHRQRPARAFIHLGAEYTAAWTPPPSSFLLPSFSLSFTVPVCNEGAVGGGTRGRREDRMGGGGVRRRLLKYSELSLSTLSINYQNMCERRPGWERRALAAIVFLPVLTFYFKLYLYRGKLSKQHVLFQQKPHIHDTYMNMYSALTRTLGSFTGATDG